ncbi:hypothetical conserved protein [Candidatus Nitrosoglobus terrae]|uniref:Hypothetical conserved protein n=1 Tax=Candidatus Nitrosoglobus terrae TaxID=1630141 RepID=A0A1Q2SJX9_9GAMM|nr:hypothetical protein [Candidatus Nitrosoglobus terrae]BAW79422.1 hypothetical conserved protein [Candidatus Nitrosoglobus terrae]
MSDKELKIADPRRSRWIILIIFIISALPVISAWWILKKLPEKGKFATSNYGELITPVIPIKDNMILKMLTDESFATSKLKGKWTLIIFGSSECTDKCQENLYKTRQVRLALGNKDMYRIQRLWVTNNVNALNGVNWVQKEHPDLLVASEEGENKEFSNQFMLPNVLDPMISQRVYIVDPLENIMMSYPSNEKAEHILKDLKRLLFVSHIG